jgi:D,D-heptose 1,7-bisphosphate phosphatase
MAERAVFLDRDNTIIDNDGYLGDPSKVKLLQGAATAIAAIRRLGYRIVVVSNQSGVARGMFDEAAVEAVNQEMCRQLREQAGAHIDASYYCPYHPDAVIAEYKLDHDWRKPKPGMLTQAAEDFGLDLTQCWMIGDQPRDIAAGASGGCRTILLRDPDHPAADADPKGTEVSPNFIVKTLADAARIVVREGRNPHPDLVPTPLNQPAAAPPSPPPPEPSNAARSADEINSVASAAATTHTGEQLAQRMEKAIAAGLSRQENLKPLLEEIATHLRQQARVREQPEFSMSKLLALIAQFAVLVCLLLGAYESVATFSNAPAGTMDWYTHVIFLQDRTISLLGAGLWFLAAMVLQGTVVAIYARKR